MFTSIWEDLKREFSQGNMVTRIILANLFVFVTIVLAKLLLGFPIAGSETTIYSKILEWLMLSSDWQEALMRPWTWFTSMFLHEGLMHILWNMIILYFFGRIVGDLIGDQKVLPIYILGGLAAGLVYFISANILPYAAGSTHYALGASGAVMAMVLTAGVVAPDYVVRLILLGDVKIKYIAAFLLLVDLIAIGNNMNTGGHFAHLGGAAFGWFFVYQLKNGVDYSIKFNSFFTKLGNLFRGKVNTSGDGRRTKSRSTSTKKKPKFTIIRGTAATVGEQASSDVTHQEKLDTILDKIKVNGYDSLSKDEKEFLFDASNK